MHANIPFPEDASGVQDGDGGKLICGLDVWIKFLTILKCPVLCIH
jgi:hypothetical protein